MNKVSATALVLLGSIIPFLVSAQDLETAATILSVKTALEEVLKKFNTTLQTAGNEARSTGVSLSQNAGNLLSDIDLKFGNRLNDTVSSLSKLEQQTIDDTILLTKQIQHATETVVKTSGQEARIAMGDADITAYNASYSLPCRDWIPRVVYVTPNEIRTSGDVPTIKVRGNFLDIGKEPAITIDGSPAKLVARSRNELDIEIPEAVIDKVDHAQAFRISIPLEQTKRYGIPWLLCPSWTSKPENDLTAAVTLRPNVQIKVSGQIDGTQGSYVYQDQPEQKYGRSDNDCDASFDDNKQYCVPDGWQFDNVIGWAVDSANCNSSVGSPQVSGGNCVMVPAHLGGCGYDNLYLAKNCRGRGFFDYRITLRAKKGARSPIESWEFSQESSVPLQLTFVFAHPRSKDSMEKPDWTYRLALVIKEGNKAPHTIQASNVNPNPENIATRIENGVLAIEIKPLSTW